MKKKRIGRYIVADPKVCHGKLTFTGTRILVADVLELVASRMTWDEIIRECHNSISSAAISEAVRIAGRLLVEHANEYVEEPISA